VTEKSSALATNDTIAVDDGRDLRDRSAELRQLSAQLRAEVADARDAIAHTADLALSRRTPPPS
jgi:hypothetical protein